MALDPNIIMQAGNFAKIDPAQLLETRAQLGMRNAALAKAQRDEQLAAAKTVRLGQIGSIAATGDYAGATRQALEAGDFDLVDHVSKLDDRAKSALANKVGVAAPVFATALAEPDPAKRTQIIAAALPTLKANGYSDEEIAKINPSNEFLQGAVGNARKLEDIFSSQEKALDRNLRHEEAAATREFSRGNAYISAGIIPPGGGGAPGTIAPAGGSTAGRTQYGWTPRARNGGDNDDAAVDGKISGMAAALGIDPDAPITSLSPIQIAEALTLSEGGKGSLADRNNNPGNLINPRTGGYQKFPTREAGLQAAAAQVRRNLARGQTTIRTMVEGLPVGGAPAAGGLTPIPGGKLDKPKPARMTAEEVQAEGLDPSVVYYRDASGVPQAVSGQAKGTAGGNLKPPPVAATKAYIDNRTSIRKLREAYAAVDKNPNAVGFLKGLTPNAISSRTDPNGVDARAKIADIGSLLIHDRSGAAVTVAETPRLLPFVPQVGDDAKTAKTKLHNLRLALEGENSDIADAYSADQGYKFPQFKDGTLSVRPRAQPRATASSGPKVGTVENGYRFKGGNPASPQAWEKVK